MSKNINIGKINLIRNKLLTFSKFNLRIFTFNTASEILLMKYTTYHKAFNENVYIN